MIGCGKRIDSVQPEKNSISRTRKKKCCTPFSCLGGPNGPTERETNSWLYNVDGHHRRWMWKPICFGMSKRYRSCRFGWWGPGFRMDPNTFFYVGTERSSRSHAHWWELRHTLIYILCYSAYSISYPPTALKRSKNIYFAAWIGVDRLRETNIFSGSRV